MKLYRIIGAEGRITIPYVLRQIIGFCPSDVVSFELIGENTIRVCREQLVGRDVPYYLASLGSLVVTIPLNFVLNKFWAFKA